MPPTPYAPTVEVWAPDQLSSVHLGELAAVNLGGTEMGSKQDAVRNARNRSEGPELTGTEAGTGCSVLCAVLGCGTMHTGHSGWYRNEIDNYAF
jgi:hypothetical protein